MTTTTPTTRADRRGEDQVPAQTSPVGKWVRDTAAVFLREFLVILRDPFTLIFSLLQPLVFLGLFGPLLDGMLGDASIGGASALQWFLPGVLVMIAVFGRRQQRQGVQRLAEHVDGFGKGRAGDGALARHRPLTDGLAG